MYFIHAQREDQDNPITLDEWKAFLDQDPDMHYTNTVTYTSPFGEQVTKGGGHYGIWQKDGKDVAFWFDETDGIVSVVYDSTTLSKLHQISNYFNGYVCGDMGEEL